MRDFNKLFVIAMPRCATVSMSDALGILGIPIAHLGKIYGEAGSEHHHPQRLARMLQQIEGNDFRLDLLDSCRGLADYPACCSSVFRQLDQVYPNSLFINVGRQSSIQRWLQSVESQFVGLEIMNSGRTASAAQFEHFQVMLRYRKMTFSSAKFDPVTYARAYDDYQSEVKNYFRNRAGDLLQFDDVSELASNGFEKLCSFLQIESPPVLPFPRSNHHSQMPEQAFFVALRSGKITSQTGLS